MWTFRSVQGPVLAAGGLQVNKSGCFFSRSYSSVQGERYTESIKMLDVEGFFKNILLQTRRLTTVILRFHLRVLITDFIQSITLISQSFRKASLCSDPRHGSISRPHWIIPSAFVRFLPFRGCWLYFQIQPLRHFCVILREWQPDVSSAGPVAFSGTLL